MCAMQMKANQHIQDRLVMEGDLPLLEATPAGWRHRRSEGYVALCIRLAYLCLKHAIQPMARHAR
jgi:hypothetical protein